MKKLILFLLLIISLNTYAIKIATWNVRNLSYKSRSEAELGIISLVIQKYDIIILQEVRDDNVINEIKNILNSNDIFRLGYKSSVSYQVGTKRKEKYAVLYKEGIELFSRMEIESTLERNPYYFRFAVDGKCISILTTHIIFGNVTERIKEYDELLRVGKTLIKDNDSFFILGDFNLDLHSYFIKDYKVLITTGTTIAGSAYDNILEHKDNKCRVINTEVFMLNKLFFDEEEDSVMNRVISDHNPVSMEVTYGEE